MIRSLLMIFLTATCFGSVGLSQDKYAVLIGIESYSGFEPLNFAEDDANELAQSFEKLGFQTTLMTGQQRNSALKPTSAAKILKTLETVIKNCGNGDTLVVSLSGHGIQFSDEPLLDSGVRETYFCPEDAQLSDKETLIPIYQRLVKMVNDCPASQKLVLIDACRNEVLSEEGKRKGGVARIELGAIHENRRSIPGGMSVLYSCSNNQFSWEHKDLGHSVFSYFVTQYLIGSAGDQFYENSQVDLDGLIYFVRKRTNEFVFNQNLSPNGQLPTLAGSSTNWIIGKKQYSLIRNRESDYSYDESVDACIISMCEKLGDKLEEMTQNEISLGIFSGPAYPPTGSGDGIRKAFSSQLVRNGFNVAPRAPFEINGEYRSIEEDSGTIKLRISARIIESRSGDELLRVDETISNPVSLMESLGMNLCDIGESPSDIKISAFVKGSISDPLIAVSNNQTFSEPNSKEFGIELIVKDANSPQGFRNAELINNKGLVFAALNPEDVYAIRLINNHARDATVELSIDGINTFAFSGFTTKRFFVKRSSTMTVKGWPTSMNTSDQFRITSYAQSAAASIGKPRSETGTITATFRLAWDDKELPPDDEFSKTRGGINDLATGRGQQIESKFQKVKVNQGRVRGVVNIRYSR